MNKMIEHSLPYVTGMGYRFLCDYVYDEFEKFNINNIEQFDGMKIFVKTDFLFEFEKIVLNNINKNFYIYTHNSDYEIDNKFNNILNNQYLIYWYGININISNDKLKSIPIGLPNKRWECGNITIFDKILNCNITKEQMIYCNFDINTNINERSYCLRNIIPLNNTPRKLYEEYLTDIAKSYFIISPNGNGIDCHKHWEAIYFKTIPIVTESININHYHNYPFLVIKDWSEFKNLELTIDLYNKIWNNFDIKKLNLI